MFRIFFLTLSFPLAGLADDLVVSIRPASLTERARIKVCNPAKSPVHVEISPDGRQAIATLNGAHAILFCQLDEKGIPHIHRHRLPVNGEPVAIAR